MSAKSLSPKLQEVLEKRISERKRFYTDDKTGITAPFVFKLEGADSVDRTVQPPKLMRKNAYLPPKTDVYDPYDKKQPVKIVRNVTDVDIRWDEDKQREVSVENVEPVEFVQSYCYVQVNEVNKLAYLMFGDGNMSKPSYLKRQGANPMIKWEESNTTLYSGRDRNEVGDIMLLSKALEVAKRADFTRQQLVLSTVCKEEKFKDYNPAGKSSMAINNDFFIFAKNYPRQFLHTNVENDTKVEVLVAECELKGILRLDREKAKWDIAKGDDYVKFMAFNAITDTDPEKALVKFLLDAKNANSLKNLEYANKPKHHPYLPADDEVVNEAVPAEA